MALTRRHPTLRAAMALALTYLMVWGSVPAPALAQMAEEATVVAQSAELAAQGETCHFRALRPQEKGQRMSQSDVT
ncbi:MAG: hypothetical protein Q4A01_12195 [Coriobacteriales bacterium]|nr:hypothetical protein [Coriobacteriales bacterium]